MSEDENKENQPVENEEEPQAESVEEPVKRFRKKQQQTPRRRKSTRISNLQKNFCYQETPYCPQASTLEHG